MVVLFLFPYKQPLVDVHSLQYKRKKIKTGAEGNKGGYETRRIYAEQENQIGRV